MPTPLPRRNCDVPASFASFAAAAFPQIGVGRPGAAFISRLAQPSLAFRPATSPTRQKRPSPPETQAASSPPPPLHLLPAGTTLAGQDLHLLDIKPLSRR